jgi:protein SCO1/2
MGGTGQNTVGRFATTIALILSVVAPSHAPAQINRFPEELEGLDVVDQSHLGSILPLDLEFRDDEGRTVKLREYFDGKRPVLLTLNFYNCESLCNYQLEGLLEALKAIKWTPGDEFQIVTVSFDPLEKVATAKGKKAAYISEYGRPAAAAGWHFLTGDVESIRPLTAAVGFPYRWNAERQTWAHPACCVVLSPQGKICRYFGGILFDPPTLRLSMVEASEGKVGSIWDAIFLTCFHYISSDGKYVPYAFGIMRRRDAGTQRANEGLAP